MTTPTPKFCYHGNAADCCDACDREAIIERLKRDLAAAQEELERVRDKCNEHYLAMVQAQEARQRAEALAESYRKALDNIETGLRKAGASLPAPEITGTIEGSMNTGMCIALCLVVTEREAIDAAREGK